MTYTAKKSNKKILLIEDNPGDIRLTQEVIAVINADVSLIVLSDAEALFHHLEKNDNTFLSDAPDIIFLDLNMPKINGHDLLIKLKSHQKYQSIPVIILSTSSAAFDVKRAYENHANAYMVKPLDFNEFVRTFNAFYDFWIKTAILPSNK